MFVMDCVDKSGMANSFQCSHYSLPQFVSLQVFRTLHYSYINQSLSPSLDSITIFKSCKLLVHLLLSSEDSKIPTIIKVIFYHIEVFA